MTVARQGDRRGVWRVFRDHEQVVPVVLTVVEQLTAAFVLLIRRFFDCCHEFLFGAFDLLNSPVCQPGRLHETILYSAYRQFLRLAL